MATQAMVNHNLLGWARHQAQLSTAALAQKIKVAESKLQEWEAGKLKPTFKQAQDLAKYTQVPFGYLYLDQPPQDYALPIPDLRTVTGESRAQMSANLRQVVSLMMARQAWYREYADDNGFDVLPFAGKFTLETPAQIIVDDMKKTLGLRERRDRGHWENYYREIRKALESVGILVMSDSMNGHYTRPLSVDEFRGFALFDMVSPLIFINHADAPNARLFTLIHEAAHIWIGASGLSDQSMQTSRKEEVLCNQVAAEFLVPAQEFNEQWQDDMTWERQIPELASHFVVSQWVIARRASVLHKITHKQYLDFTRGLKEAYERNRTAEKTAGKKSPVNPYVVKNSHVGSRFASAVIWEARAGNILHRDAGQLLALKPGKLEAFAKKVGL